MLPTDAPQESEKKLDEKTAGDKPFQLNNFKVQKGSFVVVLGPVGCGIKCGLCWLKCTVLVAEHVAAELFDAGSHA